MLSREARAERREERRAFRAYLKNPDTDHYEVKERSDYCICSVILPSIFADIGLAMRSVGAWLVSIAPFSFIKVILCRMMGVKVGRDVYISPGVVIDPFYPWLIELCDKSFLGMGCRLFTHEYTASYFRAGRVKIGKGSVVGAFSTVRSGVTIGDKATIGFNSFVNSDIADASTVGGVPAQPLRTNEEAA